MDTDLYKAQARRLGDHLAGKHGVKLGHAALLEAIAALHGARNWNVLSAQHGDSSLMTRVVKGAKELLGGTREAPAAPWATGQLIIGKNWESQQPVLLDGDAFSRHVLVVGPKSDELLTAIICHQTRGEGGCLIIDAGGNGGQFSASMSLHHLKKMPRRAEPEDTPADWLSGRTAVFENLRHFDVNGARACAAKLLGKLAEEASRQPGHAPFMVAIRGAGKLLCPELAALVVQGRAVGLSVVLATERLSALHPQTEDSELAETLLRNTRTKLILRQRDEGADREIDSRYRLSQVRQLGDNDGLFLDDQEPVMFRLAKLPG